jgi:hypothetical protein
LSFDMPLREHGEQRVSIIVHKPGKLTTHDRW